MELLNQNAFEKVGIAFSIIIAISLVALGVILSKCLSDHHWMNRAGAGIVALEGGIAILEFFRQRRLKTNQAKLIQSWEKKKGEELNNHKKEILNSEIEKSEFHIIIIAAILAFIGEILHGFGDLIFVVISSQLH